MVILHIGKISNSPFNGVCIVVPKYIYYQEKYGNAGLWNLSNEIVDGIKNQFPYMKYKSVLDLPSPFNKPNIVVFHEVYRKEYIGIYKELIKLNIPYVIVPHGSLTYMAQRKKALKKFLGNIAFYNRFIRLSSGLQLLSNSEYNNTKVNHYKFISTNGVELKNNIKTKFCENNSITITYIGRLEMKTKGLDILIDAIDIIHDFLKENSVCINIFGPDLNDRYAALEKLIKEKQLENIVSLNHEILGKDKEKQLLKTDYFIQTSRTEGMPTGILEAISYGIPCIITEGTSLGNEVLKYDAGWVSRTNSSILADFIKRAIIEKDLLSIKSNNAIKLCMDEFSWDTITHNVLECYNDILLQEI